MVYFPMENVGLGIEALWRKVVENKYGEYIRGWEPREVDGRGVLEI